MQLRLAPQGFPTRLLPRRRSRQSRDDQFLDIRVEIGGHQCSPFRRGHGGAAVQCSDKVIRRSYERVIFPL